MSHSKIQILDSGKLPIRKLSINKTGKRLIN